MSPPLILAADVGGTRTRFSLRRGNVRLAEEHFLNRDFFSFGQVLERFLATQDKARPAACCVGAAGPVRAGRVRLTNLDWDLDAAALAEAFAIPRVLVVNDLQATAAGLMALEDRDLSWLNRGRGEPGAARAVIAPGTGLGEALVLDGVAWPTEGGHTDFGPRTPEQEELLAWMHQQFEHVSYERVCSGRALPYLYAFRVQEGGGEDPLARELEGAADPTPLIVAAALRDSPLRPAREALDLFLDILAAEAANLALKCLALDGVFIGGGLPPRLLSLFDPDRFMAVFSRGVYADMLGRIPVAVITNPGAALEGAALLAARAAADKEA